MLTLCVIFQWKYFTLLDFLVSTCTCFPIPQHLPLNLSVQFDYLVWSKWKYFTIQISSPRRSGNIFMTSWKHFSASGSDHSSFIAVLQYQTPPCSLLNLWPNISIVLSKHLKGHSKENIGLYHYQYWQWFVQIFWVSNWRRERRRPLTAQACCICVFVFVCLCICVFVYLCTRHLEISVLISLDQELSENVWSEWSNTSYSEDVTMRDEQEDRATQPLDAGRLSFANSQPRLLSIVSRAKKSHSFPNPIQ